VRRGSSNPVYGAALRRALSSGARPLRLVLGASLAWFTLLVTDVRAGDFDAFEKARKAYESQDYARAVRLFEALGGGDAPALNDRSLLLESKKYLGASYLFLGKLQQAEAEFERLLRLDPQYILDPLGFPEDVQRLFARVKTRLDAERRAVEQERAREREAEAQRQQEKLLRERQRFTQLVDLAESERVVEKHSRLTGFLPFGVGQFQNGHANLGAVLAVSEGTLLLLGVTSWLVHENLRGQTPAPSERDEFRLIERTSRYANQVSFGLLGVIALAGIVDAQLRYQGDIEHVRKRAIPQELREPPKLSLGPQGLSLSFQF
jgi:tetratricopeptide (TPR) repeat protein